MRTIVFALSLAALATAGFADVPTIKIDQGYEGIGYSLSSSGSVEVYAAAREVGGKLAICGFVLTLKSTATTRTLEKRATERVAFWLGKTPLHVNTNFFKRYKTEDDLKASLLAGCDVTPTAWDPSFGKAKVRMELSNGEIRY